METEGVIMRRFIFTVVIALLVTSVFGWSSVGFKIKDHELVKDYRLPAWEYDFLSINLSGNGNYRRQDEEGKEVNSDLHSSFLPVYSRYFESEKLKYSLGASLLSDFNYSSRKESNESKDIYRVYSLRPICSGYGQYYFADNYFAEMTISPRFEYYERNLSNDSGDLTQRQYSLSTSLGIGFGNVRNVSPVFRALRLRERIQALDKGVTISNAQLQKLADQFALYDQYSTIYDRPAKYFWQQISSILGKDADALNISESLYLTEVMQESISRRQGYEVVLGLNYNFVLSNEDGEEDREYINFGPKVTYRQYHNFNLKYQLGFSTDISYTKYEENDLTTKDSNFRITLENNHLYEITDRLKWYSSITSSYEYQELKDDLEGYIISNRIYSRLDYFVENNLTMWMMVEFDIEHTDPKLDGNTSNNSTQYGERQQDYEFQIGCTYYIGQKN